MKPVLRLGILFSFCFLGSLAKAGVFEISVGGNYRHQNIEVDTFDEVTSLTGSLAYYFSELSSLELSYTDAIDKRVIGDPATTGSRFDTSYKAMALDFVWTMGSKEATLRPYVKLGPMYLIEKKIVYQYSSGGPLSSPQTTQSPTGWVPAGGFGMRIALTGSLSLKLGYDAWVSRPLGSKDASGNSYPVQVDSAARLALSWMI